MALFFSSYIHQGNDLFSVQSRGKQCAFMSLSALLTAQNIPLALIDWAIPFNIGTPPIEGSLHNPLRI